MDIRMQEKRSLELSGNGLSEQPGSHCRRKTLKSANPLGTGPILVQGRTLSDYTFDLAVNFYLPWVHKGSFSLSVKITNVFGGPSPPNPPTCMDFLSWNLDDSISI